MNGRYFAGALVVSMRTSGTISESRKIQPWSLTMTHEDLASRYWPPPAEARNTILSQETDH